MITSLLLLGCISTLPPSTTWFVAASAEQPATKAAEAYRREQGHTVVVASGATSLLARQVANGAPADLFLSASPQWTATLASTQLSRFATNRLVLAALPSAPRWDPVSHAPPGCVAVGDPHHVPAGQYLHQVLSDFQWERLAPALRPTSSAPGAVRAVESGACPFAVAYRTDVEGTSLVVRHTFDDVLPVYDMVLLSDDAAATAFFAWLTQAPAARDIFADHGFGAP